MSLRLLAARELGARSVLLYGIYQLGMKSGWYRTRTPRFDWDEYPLDHWLQDEAASPPQGPQEKAAAPPHQPIFFFADPFTLGKQITNAFPETDFRSEADAIRKGTFRLFGAEPSELGFPPDWFAYPPDAGGRVGSAGEHWTDFNEQQTEDIRLVWEPSRFSWVFPLAKAYICTEDSKYAEAFWDLLQSWMQANPPNSGPHWVSAQEAALRLLALIAAWHSFPGFSTDQRQQLLRAIAIHAERIPPTMAYAAAQRNNHLISESAALYSVGLLFPTLKDSRRWKRLGRRRFIAALKDQIFPDGGYAQYSTNYHRMVLALSVWVAQLARLNGEPLPRSLINRLARSTEFLAQSVDHLSGSSSMLGHNDGTLLFPFSSLPLSDLRPTLQAAARLFKGEERFAAGAWDELCMWLGIAKGASRTEEDIRPATAKHAGQHFMRGKSAWASARCVRFRRRPAHSDQLHLDLWWRGLNIIKDPGTYRYQADAPWDYGLSGAHVHNGPVVDSQDSMQRVSPFLWASWSRGKMVESRGSTTGASRSLVMEHDGYGAMGIRVRRTVEHVDDNTWVVSDQLLGSGTHEVCIAWTLPDLDYLRRDQTLVLQSGEGPIRLEVRGAHFDLIRAGVPIDANKVPGYASLLGWFSSSYGTKVPALCALVHADLALPSSIVAYWRLGSG